MNKSTKKRIIYNTEVVKGLAKTYGVTESFVQLSIRKERHSDRAIEIEKEYHKIASASLKALEKFKNKNSKNHAKH